MAPPGFFSAGGAAGLFWRPATYALAALRHKPACLSRPETSTSLEKPPVMH
jgi:hypothetical protein